ncbi:MAG TPA: PAS domain-containing protein, partial [Firmicutes bacterium]|nr:PAS domain-containing protein [Bacillota bacterium]
MKFFSSLRFQVAFTFLIVVIVTTLSLGSLLIKETETKFWKAEEEKLSTIGRQLVSSYNRVSEKLKVQADLLNTDLDVIKKTQLETALFDYTKPIHEENEEIGVGFFIYGDDFNRPLAVQESKSKDSEKIRVVFPVYENGKKAGFVWVEEPKDLVLSEIESLKAKERNIILVVLLISGILAIYISLMFVKKVTIIKTGLENLKSDLSYKLPVMNGEIGEISRAINDLSTSLLVSRSNSEKILETIASGVLIVSRDGIVKEFNRACEELLGVRKKDVIGKRYTLFPHLKEIVETVKGG